MNAPIRLATTNVGWNAQPEVPTATLTAHQSVTSQERMELLNAGRTPLIVDTQRRLRRFAGAEEAKLSGLGDVESFDKSLSTGQHSFIQKLATAELLQEASF